MKNFLGIFITCFLGLYILAFFFLSTFWTLLAAAAFLLTWLIRSMSWKNGSKRWKKPVPTADMGYV